MLIRDQLREDKTTVIDADAFQEPPYKKITFNYRNLSLMILPIAIAIVVIWFLVANTKSVVFDSDDKIEAIDIRKIVAQTKSQIDSTAQTEEKPDQAAHLSKNLNLNITAQMRTWFRVVIDKQDTMEYTLPAGNAMNLTAGKTYQFLIGKADGLRLILNSKDLGKLGQPGEVIQYLLIDSTGIVAKTNVIPKTTRDTNDTN